MNQFVIRRATARNLGIVEGLIDEAARWLREKKNTDQWSRSWPSPEGRTERIAAGIHGGKTWIAWDGSTAAGTITIEYGQSRSLPVLWTSRDTQPAVSVHRVVVSRAYAGIGLGEALFHWAAVQAARRGREWLHIDVWTDNTELHEYYERIGFEFVRYHHDPAYPSGALFQRRVTEMTGSPSVALVTDESPAPQEHMPLDLLGLSLVAARGRSVPAL